jgi:hypothetical protein
MSLPNPLVESLVDPNPPVPRRRLSGNLPPRPTKTIQPPNTFYQLPSLASVNSHAECTCAERMSVDLFICLHQFEDRAHLAVLKTTGQCLLICIRTDSCNTNPKQLSREFFVGHSVSTGWSESLVGHHPLAFVVGTSLTGSLS